ASGMMLFEWQDEWWKVGTKIHQETSAGPEPIFGGGWPDQDWWGLFSHTLNGRTCNNEDDAGCSPIVKNTGKLNGKPDFLFPRAAIVALYNDFHNNPPPVTPPTLTSCAPTSPPVNTDVTCTFTLGTLITSTGSVAVTVTTPSGAKVTD